MIHMFVHLHGLIFRFHLSFSLKKNILFEKYIFFLQQFQIVIQICYYLFTSFCFYLENVFLFFIFFFTLTPFSLHIFVTSFYDKRTHILVFKYIIVRYVVIMWNICYFIILFLSYNGINI